MMEPCVRFVLPGFEGIMVEITFWGRFQADVKIAWNSLQQIMFKIGFAV